MKAVDYRISFWLGLVFSLAFSYEASAQYFSRNSVQLPAIGWMAMDSSFGAVNKIKWGMTDQIQIGTGYARDIWDLKLWWLSETAVGFGFVNYLGAPPSRVAVTLQGSTGLKYNFLTQRWRPFAGAMVEVLQIFNAQKNASSLFIPSTPTWGALRPMIGLEWIFGIDMSVEAELGYVLLMNFEDPVRHGAMARLAYRLYF